MYSEHTDDNDDDETGYEAMPGADFSWLAGLSESEMEDNVPFTPEMEFVQGETHAEAVHMLREYTLEEFLRWADHARTEGLIPADWPAVNVSKPDKSIESNDWPTWVLFASLARSGSSLTIMPKSFEEIMHYAWETPTGVVVKWLGGPEKAASLARGALKTALQRSLKACRANILLVDSYGLIAQLVNVANAARVMLEDSPDLQSRMTSLTGMESGQLSGLLDISSHIRVNLLVRQTPGFQVRRVAAVVRSSPGESPFELESGDPPEVGLGAGDLRQELSFLYVLTHTDEVLRGVCHQHVKEHVEAMHGPDSCLLLIDEASPAFTNLSSSASWFTSSDPAKWILSPMARDMRDKY